MKNLSLILSVMLLMTVLCACTKTNDTSTNTVTEKKTQQNTSEEIVQQIEQTQPVLQEEHENSYESFGMPEPFEGMGGDGNHGFYMPCINKIDGFGGFFEQVFDEYLGGEYIGKWGDIINSTYLLDPKLYDITSLMDFINLFEVIISNDIPNDVVISAIDKHNEFTMNNYNESYIKFYQFDDERHERAKEVLARQIFSQEDIDALLTRDEAIVTAHFATNAAIITDNNIFTPFWLYCHTAEDYEEAGITPEMIEEKLEMYAAFEFSNEAEAAFEEKLSSFIGAEVSLN